MRKFIGYEKGINLGGWLSQCVHTKEHYDTFITEKDFAELTSWGIDHVRIPVDYNLVEDENGNTLEDGMKYIENSIEWCRKYHFNMILDLHKTAGYSFDDGENENGFFADEKLQERFLKLWETFAERFGRYHEFLSFEILNEVTDKIYCEKWNQIAEKCICRIRKYAPDIHILVGGYHNNCVEAIADLYPPHDDKIVYNFHFYEPLIFTHQGAYWLKNMPSDFRLKYPGSSEEYIKIHKNLNIGQVSIVENTKCATVATEFFDETFENAVKVAEERNVPLYCGEYGVIDTADNESTVAWYKCINESFTKHGIARAAWNYKKMDFGISESPVSDEIKKYL